MDEHLAAVSYHGAPAAHAVVILDACWDAWNALIAEPARMTGIASRRWAQANA